MGRNLVSRGQVATLQADFTSEATGLPADPTVVTLEVRTTDSGGRFVTTTYIWAGSDLPELLRLSEGSFIGLYSVQDIDQYITMKLYGSGAVIGATDEIHYFIIP